jgi:hypothetical protein
MNNSGNDMVQRTPKGPDARVWQRRNAPMFPVNSLAALKNSKVPVAAANAQHTFWKI